MPNEILEKNVIRFLAYEDLMTIRMTGNNRLRAIANAVLKQRGGKSHKFTVIPLYLFRFVKLFDFYKILRNIENFMSF